MKTYVQVLETGLTLGGSVRVAGECVAMHEGFAVQSKQDQVKRWGKPKFKEITEQEYIALTGAKPESYPPPVTKTSLAAAAPAEELAAEGGEVPAEGVPATLDEFAHLSGLNIAQTLEAASEMSEETLARFLAWERAGKNRAGVLGPLGG